MFCNQCGTDIPSTAAFCARCGAPTVHAGALQGGAATANLPALPAARGRVDKHIKILATLWGVIGALLLIATLVFGGIGTMIANFAPDDNARVFAPVFFTVMTVIFAVCGGLNVAVAFGLMRGDGWARPTAIALAFLALFSVPFGTALGIYTIWVLMGEGSDQEYRARAARA